MPVTTPEINKMIAALPSREELTPELRGLEDIAAINDYALRNPNKVFNDDFKEQRKHLTEETWKAVIQANPDMQNSASDKWRKIPNSNIVNKYQGQAFSGEVREAINEDGVKLAGLAAAVPGAIIGGGALAKPVLSLMFYHPGTFFAETVGGTVGGLAGGAATDAITRGVSDYNSFADMVASNSTIPELYAEMLNPGMLLGGLAGGVGGNVLYNNVVKPTAQRVALPYLMARLLNKNIDNTVLPSEKTVRLYRGTGTNGSISTDGGTEQAGKWFTPIKTKTGAYLSNLLAYAKRKGIDNPTYLEYVDIPESLLDYYHAKRILDPEKVEFEPEDYLIPLHIKRNRIEIPHFTNSQERLGLHSGQSLPETPSNPSNTLWDASKHMYYDIEPTKTSAAKTSLKFYYNDKMLPELEKLGLLPNTHLLGDDAVLMFKEYLNDIGDISLKESINVNLLKRYIPEVRERYGLVGNDNITDDEILKALYHHTNELGKGTAAVNVDGEPLLLFRGDTKRYSTLRSNHSEAGGTPDNILGSLFLGELPHSSGDLGVYRYLVRGTDFRGIPQVLGAGAGNSARPIIHGLILQSTPTEGRMGEVISLFPKGTIKVIEYPKSGYNVYKLPASASSTGVNDVNAFIVKTPNVRDITNEIIVAAGANAGTPPKFNWLIPKENRIGQTLNSVLKEQNIKVIQEALKANQGLLKSNKGSYFRGDEHSAYDYFALPDFNIQNAKHILPYDFRIPRNWEDPIIYRKQGGTINYLNLFK